MDGFVPTENLRFRDQVLTFKVSETAEKEEEAVKRDARYFYPDMIKDFGGFVVISCFPHNSDNLDWSIVLVFLNLKELGATVL